MMDQTNWLLFDEPTNHLDVDAKEELKRDERIQRHNRSCIAWTWVLWRFSDESMERPRLVHNAKQRNWMNLNSLVKQCTFWMEVLLFCAVLKLLKRLIECWIWPNLLELVTRSEGVTLRISVCGNPLMPCRRKGRTSLVGATPSGKHPRSVQNGIISLKLIFNLCSNNLENFEKLAHQEVFRTVGEYIKKSEFFYNKQTTIFRTFFVILELLQPVLHKNANASNFSRNNPPLLYKTVI